MGSLLEIKDPDKSLGKEKQKSTKKNWAIKEENEASWGAMAPANSGNFKTGGPKASSLL